MISLHIDEAVIRRMGAVVAHIERGVDTAAMRALRKTVMTVRAESLRLARRAYTAKPQKLIQEISVTFGVERPFRTWAKLEMRDRRGLSLYHFLPSPKTPGKRPKRGVSSKVRRDGRRYVHGPGQGKPFIMAKRQGGFGIFVRNSGDRNDLTMLYGPSPIQALQRHDNRTLLQETGTARFETYMRHEVYALAAGITSAAGGGR